MHVLLVSRELTWGVSLAESWRAAGASVTLVLLDDAAAAARAGHEESRLLATALEAGVHVAVHDAAAQRRGITTERLAAGLKTVDLDEVADLVGESAERVVWL